MLEINLFNHFTPSKMLRVTESERKREDNKRTGDSSMNYALLSRRQVESIQMKTLLENIQYYMTWARSNIS